MKELFKLDNNHFTIDAIKLNTITDFTDDVVIKETVHVFMGNSRKVTGNVFILRSKEKSYTILCFCADYQVPTLHVENFLVYLSDETFDYVILDGAESEARKYLLQFAPEKLIAMSNTWGDRNGSSRVCADFVKKEIDSAHKIGLDIMQIDDGWQKGSTADRTIFDKFGFRHFEGDFWALNTTRFPLGLEEISQYTKDKNIELGLWFAPDFHDNFKHFDRDFSVLKSAHDDNNFNFFKLDMLYISNDADKEKFIALLEKLSEFSSLELDVTNSLRLGYLLSLKYGIIFLENRYVKESSNYFPYRTLKNLWELSKYIPAQTLQCELVNPDLEPRNYGSDPYQPKNYDMDYLFACVMVSNPLFWMETQFLKENRIDELNRIFPLWKSLRDEFVKSEIIPIGEKPSGYGFTGFLIKGERTFAVLFREDTEETSFDFNIENVKVLASNGSVSKDGNKIKFSQKNCYALVEVV